MTEKNPYWTLVENFSRLKREGGQLPLGGMPRPARPEPAADAPTALIFSPHPDDECIIGGLALRLMRESGWRIINVAVTLGSRKDRQLERLQELRAACDHLGFGLVLSSPRGLENLRPETRDRSPGLWENMVRTISRLLEEHRPRVICYPHDWDWNGTHIGTSLLVADALSNTTDDFSCHVVETEFWGAMDDPNLMVEVGGVDLADLLAALSCHVGEVKRNPYHLLVPAWMMDNVRRGGELVGGQGGTPPDFTFATLYRLRRWQEGRFENVLDEGRLLGAGESPDRLFNPPAAQ